MIIPAALLANIINAGTDILTLAEGMDESEFLRARLDYMLQFFRRRPQVSFGLPTLSDIVI